MFQNLLWVYGMAWMSVRFPGLKFCPSPPLLYSICYEKQQPAHLEIIATTCHSCNINLKRIEKSILLTDYLLYILQEVRQNLPQ